MKNYEKVQTVNLDPQTSQKSFGGRAKVTTFVTADGTLVEVLKSYETDVAAAVVRGGKTEIFRLYDEDFFEGNIEGWRYRTFYGYSATTGKHLESFHLAMGLGWNGKKAWESKNPVTFDEVMERADPYLREI